LTSTGSHRIGTADASFVFEQANDDHSLLQAALRQGMAFPYECSSGGCGSCRFKPVEGAFEVLWEEAPGLSRRDRRKGLQLACQTRATSDLIIEVSPDEGCRPLVIPARRRVTLASREEVTHDIVEFRFTAEEAAAFLPGQYAVLENADGVRRCYSMSGVPEGGSDWSFQIRRVPGGRFTEWLFGAPMGTEVVLDGPYGMAHLRPDVDREVLCVAGGSGLSPIVSILRALAGLGGGRRIHFFHGGRTPRDLFAPALVEELGLGDRLEYVPVVSDPENQLSADWAGATGFVHEAVATALGERVREMEVYFAGPPPMAEAMQRMLMVDLGVPFGQIHFDRFF